MHVTSRVSVVPSANSTRSARPQQTWRFASRCALVAYMVLLARGFDGGVVASAAPIAVQPDTVWSYELHGPDTAVLSTTAPDTVAIDSIVVVRDSAVFPYGSVGLRTSPDSPLHDWYYQVLPDNDYTRAFDTLHLTLSHPVTFHTIFLQGVICLLKGQRSNAVDTGAVRVVFWCGGYSDTLVVVGTVVPPCAVARAAEACAVPYVHRGEYSVRVEMNGRIVPRTSGLFPSQTRVRIQCSPGAVFCERYVNRQGLR